MTYLARGGLNPAGVSKSACKRGLIQKLPINSFPDRCADQNSECKERAGSGKCFCKKGFIGLELKILIVPYLNKDRAETGHICFVQEGKPCQADLLHNMLNDTDNIFTEPGKFQKVIQDFEVAIEKFWNETRNPPPTVIHKDYHSEWVFLTKRLEAWKEFLKMGNGMFGKSGEHWSCASGRCSSDNKCDSGTNPLLGPLPDHLQETTTPSRTSKSIQSIPFISYLFILTILCEFVLEFALLHENIFLSVKTKTE